VSVVDGDDSRNGADRRDGQRDDGYCEHAYDGSPRHRQGARRASTAPACSMEDCFDETRRIMTLAHPAISFGS
jgi:hypothetical protein